ncbi:Collagenase 3 [Platysternon megacephalum]|uniref:Collagenase 3 n=1 Tax=Platysternon megacephalum TaxID=55544 RepID=A0A4D9F528_9SAUR|nr:Collagenase 3 [Platysternon megacephalum]
MSTETTYLLRYGRYIGPEQQKIETKKPGSQASSVDGQEGLKQSTLYDASIENNVDDPDFLDEGSRERGKMYDTDFKLCTIALVSESAESTSEEQDKSLDKPKQKKNRCFMCRKKVGLTGQYFCLQGLNAGVETFTVVCTVIQMYTVALTITKLMLLRKSGKKIL